MRQLGRYAVGAALVAAMSACTSDATESAPSPSPTVPVTDDPVAQCVHQLSYWVAESLRDAPDLGYDYQEMGLSNAKYQALRGVLERVAEQQESGALPAGWVATEVTEACRDVVAMPSSTSTGGGWQ